MGNNHVNDSYKWVILAISFLIMMGFAFSLQALPPLFSQIAKDVSFSNSQEGMLMGAYAIPGIFLPLLIAYMANRFDMKAMILAGLLIMIVGVTAFSLAGSFSLLFFCRLIAGVGATVVIVLAPILITMFFDEKNIGLGMGIFNIAVPTGTVLAANLFGYLGGVVGWRGIMWIIAGYLAVVLALVFFALYLPKNEIGNNSSSSGSSSNIGGNLGVWLLAAIWALANLQLLSYMTFGSKLYQSLGISVQSAGFLTSLIMLVSIFLAPIIGIIFDKTGRKKPYLLIGSFISLVSFAFLAKNILPLPLLALGLGIGFTPIPVFVFAYLPQIVKPHQIGMGMGILTVASNLGTTIGPPALGSILDLTAGNFSIAFMGLSLVSLIIILITWLGLKPLKAGQNYL